MNPTVAKILRTLVNEFPFLKDARDACCFYVRKYLSIPHERDFKALRQIGPPYADRVLLDIGANQGQSIESMKIYWPSLPIVSFEANPYLAQKLQDRYKHVKNVRILPNGLSDSAGTLTLYVPSYKGFVYDGLGSFDRNAAASWISEETVFGFDSSRLTIAETSCQVSTLDAQNLAPFFIKVDVQGYEYNVLKGGVETLRMYEPVLLVESYRHDLRTVQLAEELGYEEYHFDGYRIEKGSPLHSFNSFLITQRMAEFVTELSCRNSTCLWRNE
jgi:FkbM family methyltransferase